MLVYVKIYIWKAGIVHVSSVSSVNRPNVPLCFPAQQLANLSE